MKRMKIFSRKTKSFTLLETIIYIAIFGLVFLAITNAIITFYQSNRYTLEQMNQLDSARKGVSALVTGIREATYSESGAYPIESAEESSMTFYADTDNDGTVERVRYFLSGNNFQKGVIVPTGSPAVYAPASEIVTTLAEYIRNAEQGVNMFAYYDTNGALMTEPVTLVGVRYVKISVIVNVNPATMPNEFTLRSSATIRNIKSNL
ncbi:MAG: prepilin-type N-terminal cleavage/methylation domain-containing protein [Parcubacteria group bacterium]|nr:prepilin-type N-terminal cleavage/methylation domain-containing protein [Parcubacteria group bacterium]